jgi:hypothetical protein
MEKIKEKKNGQVIKRNENGIWKIANYVDGKLDGEYKTFRGGLGVCTEHKIYKKGKVIQTIIDPFNTL